MSKRTGIVKDRRYLRHGTEFFPPEVPGRLISIYEMLEDPQMAWKFTGIEPRYAEEKELALFHSRSYIDLVASTEGKPHFSLDPDTMTTAESYDVARLAVGGFMNAIDAVLAGEVDNAFALVRPPGHHAQASDGAGFCIFNNMALGALHALRRAGIDRILIVDWDLHHGNGTQQAFYEDRRVLYFSTHQYPGYPGTGALMETGRGPGAGYTVNIPVPAGAGDAEYVKIFKRILEPLTRSFKPDLLLLSAGFDIYYGDPLGRMKVTPAGFARLMRILLDLAEKCCGGRLVVTLEGGYNIAGLTKSVKAVLEEMTGDTRASEKEMLRMAHEPDIAIDSLIDRVRDQIRNYWMISQKE